MTFAANVVPSDGSHAKQFLKTNSSVSLLKITKCPRLNTKDSDLKKYISKSKIKETILNITHTTLIDP